MILDRVAPIELIIKDFENLKTQERLFTIPDIEDLILIQSLEGRAHNGAGAFGKMYYVNTTVDDIVISLGLDPLKVRQMRQQLIEDIVEYAKSAISANAREKLLNGKEEPLLGIPLFKERVVNPNDILKGLYLGGLRDNHKIREKTEQIYNKNIGYGECFLIDIKKMKEMNLDAEILAHQPHYEKIDYYKSIGLIVEKKSIEEVDNSRFRYFYIRYKAGPGQSDDAAIVISGLIYNSDVALGVFLSDAIDTLEKYSLYFKDQDDELSHLIGECLPSMGISLEDVYEFAFLASIPEGEEENLPDSSLRYLLTIDPQTHISTLENHLSFIEKRFYFPMVISYKRILATGFYEFVRDRIISVEKTTPVVTYSLLEKEFSKTLGELANRNFLLMEQDASLKDAINKMIDKKLNVIIVQDASKNIIGILNANDFLHLLTKGHLNA
ncbi:MAG: CBS domain-containing protein [Candidatus Omnitrophica bacterium]|nr:CBS domain-containing protein [Candidatus Omnitrophota bacterium]